MLANLFIYNKIVNVTSENILHIYLFNQTSILNTIILIDYGYIKLLKCIVFWYKGDEYYIPFFKSFFNFTRLIIKSLRLSLHKSQSVFFFHNP